jgi:la-related protein 1
MDKEGWISIAMIASFNRIKNITPEVSLVKEMMELSSLLEVQGDHVRIRGEDSKKWVLPDAKPSPFPPTVSVSVSNTPATASVSDTLDETMSLSLEESTAVSECMSVNPENAFDMKDMGFGTELKYQPDEVKAALMKSGSGMGAVPSKGEGLDALEVAAALARAGAQAQEESVKKEEVVLNGNALHDGQVQEETKTESA